MHKKGIYILTVITTALAVIARIWITLYHTDPLTGKFDSVIWQIINAAALILCILSALWVFSQRYTDYKIQFSQNTAAARSFSVLAAMSSLISSIYCIWRYRTAADGAFSVYIAAAGVLSTIFFLYAAFRINKTKKEPVLYLATGPFLFFILRIIEIFNFYSRNISLYTYQYEIVGMCCIIMFFLLFIGAATEKTSAKTALFFSLTAFSFLFIYSVPQILLPLFSQGYFSNNASPYYVYSDLLFGICALYFGTLMNRVKIVKH